MKVNIAKDTVDKLKDSYISSGATVQSSLQDASLIQEAVPLEGQAQKTIQKVINITEKDIDNILKE